MGISHVKGMLLYGPPGCGKTLIAREIGRLLKARAPKIVNGPEVLDKWVGEAERNVRSLFYEAENEWQEMGDKSALHLIIFDEFDAIAKPRGMLRVRRKWRKGGEGGQDRTVEERRVEERGEERRGEERSGEERSGEERRGEVRGEGRRGEGRRGETRRGLEYLADVVQGDSSGVRDSVVNQLLSILDGVNGEGGGEGGDVEEEKENRGGG
eukprot:768439-Hanusia_phi.AAC.2